MSLKAIANPDHRLTFEVVGTPCRLTIEALPWDSQMLERQAGRLVDLKGSVLDVHALRDLADLLRGQNLDYVTVRVPQAQIQWIQAFEHAGFVMVDHIVEFAKPVSVKEPAPLSSGYKFRLATEADVPAVSELSVKTFKLSRFHSDPLVTPEQREKVHSEWAKNCCLGQTAEVVWVIENHGHVVAFITCKRRDQIGIIDLVAVAENESGRGLGRALMAQAENWFAQNRCREAQVQTQSHNYAALALYSTAGYKIRLASTTLRWSGSKQ